MTMILQVTELFSSHVDAMLKKAAAAPTTEWKSKDCALFLVTALAARTKTASGGATTTNDLVNIGDFYRC
jgi:exportin-2 (importin alpha re-exporter)